MPVPSVAPYGSWKSPITSDLITRATARPTDLVVKNGAIYVAESRPEEQGRSVVVRLDGSGNARDVTPKSANARTRVHEYGGGAFTVAGDAVVYSNFKDGRLYVTTEAGDATPLTAAGAQRYADLVVDEGRRRLVCVVEDHSEPSREPTNFLASVSLADGSVKPLATGADFYSSPRVSRDGSRIAWLSWRHPNMPWDGTELTVGELSADGRVVEAHVVAGGVDESVFQPEWHPDGALFYVTDRSGFWNLHRHDRHGSEAVLPRDAEFGVPQWVFGMSTYAVLDDGTLFVTFAERGRLLAGRFDPTKRALETLEFPFSDVSNVRASGSDVVLFAGSPSAAPALVRVHAGTGATSILRRFSAESVDPAYVSLPEPIEFPTTSGARAYALYYRPKNRDFTAPAGEKPPLLVKSHGGPTAAASSALSLRIQYFTSRGFAVLDVDYRGSSGYGRAYRRALDGEWGVHDVDDCVAAANHVVARGEADPRRLAISGGSAGGYTTLAALAFRDVFSAGASHYGISDLEALATDTHKFESRYLDRLIGPYPAQKDLYRARSPIHHVEGLSCPVIFFQGLEDRVVPPNQAERMVKALEEKGVPVAYVPFEGEQHGFRKAENIRRSLDGELYFYARIFGFPLADAVDPVPIAVETP